MPPCWLQQKGGETFFYPPSVASPPLLNFFFQPLWNALALSAGLPIFFSIPTLGGLGQFLLSTCSLSQTKAPAFICHELATKWSQLSSFYLDCNFFLFLIVYFFYYEWFEPKLTIDSLLCLIYCSQLSKIITDCASVKEKHIYRYFKNSFK